MAEENKLPEINKYEFVNIYPVYLDGTRPMRLGRKLPKSQCCEGLPHAQALAVVVNQIPLPFILEPNKAHPRDTWVRGRLRVKLWQDRKKGTAEDSKDGDPDDKVPINPNFKTRKDLLIHLGKEVQVMKEKMDEANALAAAARAAEEGSDGAAGGAGGAKAADKKKKDKKKKKK
jgi:signal recognition particle subunit SEC65